MKKFFLLFTLCYLTFSFNACSSDNEEEGTPESGSVKTCNNFWITIEEETSKVETGSYNDATHTLTLKTQNGKSFSFTFDEFINTSQENKKFISSFVYKGVTFVPLAGSLTTLQSFSYVYTEEYYFFTMHSKGKYIGNNKVVYLHGKVDDRSEPTISFYK